MAIESKWSDLVNAESEKFWQKIEELAEQLRQEVIIPACRKHGFQFTSGMGTFFFYKKNNRTRIELHDAKEAAVLGKDY